MADKTLGAYGRIKHAVLQARQRINAYDSGLISKQPSTAVEVDALDLERMLSDVDELMGLAAKAYLFTLPAGCPSCGSDGGWFVVDTTTGDTQSGFDTCPTCTPTGRQLALMVQAVQMSRTGLFPSVGDGHSEFNLNNPSDVEFLNRMRAERNL